MQKSSVLKYDYSSSPRANTPPLSSKAISDAVKKMPGEEESTGEADFMEDHNSLMFEETDECVSEEEGTYSSSPVLNPASNDDKNLEVSSHNLIQLDPHEVGVEVSISDQDFVSTEGQSSVSPEKRSNRVKVSRSDFEILKVVGKGAYGKVYLVRKVSGNDKGTLYAMKVLRKATMIFVKKKDKKDATSVRKVTSSEETQVEKNILLQLRHPFIVKLYYSFQTNSRLYLILDFVSGGELFSYLSKERMLSEDSASFFLAEIVLALEHLHSCGVIYRDLKPENILLDKEGHVKLTDFGLSKVALDGRTTTMCGTLEYMAPEIIKELPYNSSVDWWSLGILAFDMIVGNPPFTSNNRKSTCDKICKEKLKLPKYLSNECKDLLTKLLKKEAIHRLGSKTGSDEIKGHRFFRNIDWKKLVQREQTPPIIPPNAFGVENFSSNFTDLPPTESPCDGSPLSASMDALFLGFSYMDLNLALDGDTL